MYTKKTMADCQKREREDGKNGTTKLWVHLHGLLCVVFLALLLYDNFSAGRNDALGIDDASGGLGPYIKVLFFCNSHYVVCPNTRIEIL